MRFTNTKIFGLYFLFFFTIVGLTVIVLADSSLDIALHSI